ncbi:MAG: type III-A CRISPR-associated RAMP protein Csm5 [Bacteroidota bacterium]
MKLRLQTYSPVHIGTGEELNSMDYVILGQNYYRVSLDRFLQFLEAMDEQKKSSLPLAEQFGEWVIARTEELNDLHENRRYHQEKLGKRDYNQQLTQLQQETNLLKFCEQHRLKREFESFLEQSSQDKTIRKYQINSRRKLKVRGQLVNAKHELYIPGTSLKGAIRTALLYQAMKGYGADYQRHLIDSIAKDIRKQRNPRQLAMRVGSTLEPSMAYGGIRTQIKNQQGEKRTITKYNDVQQDVFKFLRVSDARILPEQNDPIEVVKTDLYLVNQVSRDPNNRAFKATKQPQSPYIEAIRRGVRFEFKVEVAVEEIYAISQILKSPKDRKEWIDFEQKIFQIYQIEVGKLSQHKLSEAKKEAEDHILNSLALFAQQQAAFEEKWLERQFLKEQLDRERIPYQTETFREAFDPIFRYPKGKGRRLMRVGYGGGFPNKTMLMYFLEESGFKPVIREMMEILGIGNRPGSKGTYTANLEKFPKSRILVSYERSVAPLGWMEIGRVEDWDQMPKMSESVANDKSLAVEKAIKAEFQKKFPKRGDIIDGIFIRKGPGRQKIFQLYLTEGITQEGSTNYFADLEEGKIYQLQVNAADKKAQKVQSFICRGLKKHKS